MIVVLINDTVKKYLLKQADSVKKKIRDKFEFLESGIWDGGLKVKKLKGVSSKRVFEARLDRGNRILFTLGCAGRDGRDGPTGKHSLVVYVWGIVVHDAVSKKSRTIIPENVPFLQFTNYTEARLDNVDMEELGPSYFTQETITEKISDESGSQKWFPIDRSEWKRIQLYRRENFELFLYLTPEQKDILHTPLPLMISGTAGSGKTTLSVYYLLNRNLNKKKKLFITYNRHLKNFAKKLYNGLLNEREWKEEAIPPDFHTFKELCMEIAGEHRFPPGNEVDFNRFNQLFTAYRGGRSFDPVLVWEEIRAIIKGAVPRVNLTVLEKTLKEIQRGNPAPASVKQLQTQFILFSKLESMEAVHKLIQKYLKTNTASFAAAIEKFLFSDNPREREGVVSILDKTLHTLQKQRYRDRKKYLSFLEYESLGKKKAPNFTFNRKDIYRIFEWYQTKLENEKLWDELDLTAEAVGGGNVYDTLVCDEVQDFTDTQLDLLFQFVKDPNHMFLAGDTKQIINPSGFRWEEVRKHFYERGLTVPGLKTLSLNFRSSGSIVELSNILLELKEKFTGKKAEESKEEWKYKGRPVTVASGIAGKDMLDLLKTAGAKRTILVRTDPEKEKLKKHLGTELVFTIKEAKGLEFDTVVLWKFCREQTAEDVWKVTLDMSDRNIHEATIKHEINLLYVGITRSQKDLIVYDGKTPSVIWESGPIGDNVYITGDRQFLEGVWNVVSSPGEWVEQGHYFFERGYFKAAAECFKNGGDLPNLAKAGAFYYEKTGNYREAAVNFEKLRELEKAAVNYENAGDFKQALRLWEKLKNKERVFLCGAAVLKGEGKFREAGLLYIKKKKYSEAAECFKQSDAYGELAVLYQKHFKDNNQAARYYEYSRDYEKAAGLYVRLKAYEKAAVLYYRSKNYPKAEALWKKTKNTDQLRDLYRKTGQDEKLFLIYEKEKNFEKAVKYLKILDRDKDRLKEEAGELFQKGRYFQASLRFFAAKDPGGIAESFYKLKKYRESIEYFEAAGDRYSAANAYYKIKEYEKALKGYLSSEEDKKNGRALALRAMRKIRDWELVDVIAQDFYSEEDYEPAAFLFSQLERREAKQGVCYALMGNTRKTFETWRSCRDYYSFEEIAKVCVEKEIIDTGAEFFLSLTDESQSGLPFSFSTFYEDHTQILYLMDAYFKKNPDLDRMGVWAKFVAEKDFNYDHVKYVSQNLEKTGRYSDLIAYFKRYEDFSPRFSLEEGIDFGEEISPPGETGADPDEARGFRYIIQGNTDELTRLLPKLKINKNNFAFFLEGDAAFRKKTYDWCDKNDCIKELIDFLVKTHEHIKMAEFYEQQGELSYAAQYYEWGAEFRKAAGFYEQSGKYGPAGDCYYKVKGFKKALEMFKKQSPQDKKKLAKTYERLKDFESALKLWKKLGNPKAIRRCKKKLGHEDGAQQKGLQFEMLP